MGIQSLLFFWANTGKPEEIWDGVIPSYSNEQSWASVDYTAMFRPGMTPLFCCNPKRTELGAFVWFILICRTCMTIASTVIFWLDWDGSWYFNPEQVVYILCMGYVVPTTLVYFLRLHPAVALSTAKTIPMPLKFSWFCFDIALPASFGCLILYCINVVVNKRNPMTLGLYVCNFVQMVALEALFGRMVLIPNRFVLFMGVWIVCGVWFYIHFKANVHEFLVGLFLGVISFVVMSWFTYFRVKLFHDDKLVLTPKSATVDNTKHVTISLPGGVESVGSETTLEIT